MKILIIDDEYTIRHGIATVIRKYNERWTIVGEASDVSQALSIIRQERPDVIFLDIKMPGKSGIDLLHTEKFFRGIEKRLAIENDSCYYIGIFRFCLCSAGFEIWGF